jgi:hypothetical protein
MPRPRRSDSERFQVNVPLDSEHWHLVLRLLTEREGSTVPELLRPVIIRFLRREEKKDVDLAEAVARLERSRETAQARRTSASLAHVTPIGRSHKQQGSTRGKPKDSRGS